MLAPYMIGFSSLFIETSRKNLSFENHRIGLYFSSENRRSLDWIYKKIMEKYLSLQFLYCNIWKTSTLRESKQDISSLPVRICARLPNMDIDKKQDLLGLWGSCRPMPTCGFTKYEPDVS